MDKRTLFFVLALTLSLYGVNIFFDQRNTESLRQWKQEQTAKSEEKLKKLSKEVELRTVKASALPAVVLYGDAEGTHPLADAVQTDKAILVLAWSHELPKTVYAKALDSQDKAVAYVLASVNAQVGTPAIYRQNATATLRIGELPEVGKYDLQLLVMPQPGDILSPTVYLGEYMDGHLEIPADKISALQNEIKGESAATAYFNGEAIVLIKTLEGYLPVAVYRSENKSLEPLDVLPGLSKLVSKSQQKTAVATNQKGVEKFYVLETPYQQLVFSNYGAALAEINLPFHSKEDQFSVVKEIEFDRDMVEHHPYNAHFPAHAYFTAGDNAKENFVVNPKGQLGGYYPLLRRDLIEKDKRKSVRILPRYYALNIVSEYPETAELIYEVKSFTKDTIVFEAVQAHRRITKTFSVASEAQAPYCIDLTIAIEGDSRGLWVTSGVPEVEWISGAPAPALKYRITRNQKSEVEVIDPPKDSLTVSSTISTGYAHQTAF